MIELREVHKSYKYAGGVVKALDGLSLTIDKGDFVAVTGKSGSGKSTLLNLIGGMDNADQGKLYWEGVPLAPAQSEKGAWHRNARIGFVIQDFALISEESVLFNICLPAYIGKGSIRKAREKSRRLLEKLDLRGLEKKRINQLSGGQRQRVAIARALIQQAPVLLADEPTGQLDSQTSRQIMEIFRGLNQEGKTILMVTHDLEMAAYAKRVIELKDGRIINDRRQDTAS